MRHFYRRGFRFTWVVLLSTFLVACAGTPASDGFDTPTVELLSIKPLPSRGMEARFEITLRVVNPNSGALKIEGLYYELAVQGKDIVDGTSNQTVTIDAYSEGLIILEARAGMFGAFGLLRELMKNPPDSGFSYELKTKISLSGYPIPIRIKKVGVFGRGLTTGK